MTWASYCIAIRAWACTHRDISLQIATDSPPSLHRLFLCFPRSPLSTGFASLLVIFILCLAGIDREKTGLDSLENSAGPSLITLLDFWLHFFARAYLPTSRPFFSLPLFLPLNTLPIILFFPCPWLIEVFGSYRIFFDTPLSSTFIPGLFGLGPSDLQIPGQSVPRTRRLIPLTRPNKFCRSLPTSRS